jgi:hypothetical protein
MPKVGQTWLQAPVNPFVKHRVKVYAADHNLTLRQAVSSLIIAALGITPEEMDAATEAPDEVEEQVYVAPEQAHEIL